MNLRQFHYQQLMYDVYIKFRDYFPEEYDILRMVNNRVDMLITKGEKRVAIVEVKLRNSYEHDTININNYVTELAFHEKVRYAIIAVDNDKFYLKDCISDKNGVFKSYLFVDICQTILHMKDDVSKVVGKDYNDALFGFLNSTSDCTNGKIKDFITKYENTSLVEDEKHFFFEREGVEDDFFKCFLKEFEGNKVCRYTSLSSLFRTILNGSQSMCCIVGMNDRSECTYADTYIQRYNDVERPKQSLYEAGVENRYFILSCMEESKKDDLTMWRLYGDETKGVNIIYHVDKKIPKGFKLYKINYAKEPGDQGHDALNIVRDMGDLSINGKSFKFRRWNEWKHFFKPYEYKDELEIRLLFDKEKKPVDKWILTEDYQIVCPLMEFNLDDFPLVIEEIRLGPNCPEISVNQLQIELMIKEKEKSLRLARKMNIVTPSIIGTYRF